MSLYDDAMNSKPQYSSAEEALIAFTAEYEALGAKYGMTGYDLWLETEHARIWTDDHHKIHRLYRMIGICHRLIKRDRNG